MHKNDPVFICGALRSGTTVLRLMLNQHPNIKNPGEFDFMFDFIGANHSLTDTKNYREWLETNRMFKASGLKINPLLDLTGLIYDFVEQMEIENTVLTLNIHRYFEKVPELFPNARYIHILRDPRDVAQSFIGMGWAGNIYYGIDGWLDTEASWDKLLPLISPNQYCNLNFETLIKNPVDELTRLCEFLGLQYSAEMLDYSSHSTYSKPDASLINQWKRKCTVRNIQHLEFKAGSVMQKKGYELSGYPLRKPNFLEQIGLAVKNKHYKIFFNIDRYGWQNVFLEKLSRWFGLTKLNKGVVIKIHSLSNKFDK